MTNPLQSLKIDYWYKAILVISAVLLVISLTIPLQGVPNADVAILSLGGVLVGLGEWINHPLQERVGVGFKITSYPRNNSFLGVAFVLFGLGLAAYGVYRIAQ